MSIFRSDDPNRDFDRWDAEREERLKELPECVICREPIQDEFYYELDGANICPACLEENFRKENEAYF